MLAGVQLTRVQLDQLCDLLGIDTNDKARNNDVIQSIVYTVFPEGESRQAALDACTKPKPTKTFVDDSETTKEVISHLADDPENTDAVKEVRAAQKQQQAARRTIIKATAKGKANAKAKATATPKAKAKATAFAKAKARAKARANTNPIPVTIPPPPADGQDDPDIAGFAIDIGAGQTEDHENFWGDLPHLGNVDDAEPGAAEHTNTEGAIHATMPGAEPSVDPASELHEANHTNPDADIDIEMENLIAQYDADEQEQLWQALCGMPGWNPSSSSTSPAPVDAHVCADKAKPSRIYPTGSVKTYKTPDRLKQLNCPSDTGGTLSLDSKVHRFVATLLTNSKDKSKLVFDYVQDSKSCTFDKDNVAGWHKSLAECHFWLWTKFSRVYPKHTKHLQTPGIIPHHILTALEPFIKDLPARTDYSAKKKKAVNT